MARMDVTPPGREAQVEKLKSITSIENPYAVAWASYEHGDAVETGTTCADCGQFVPVGDALEDHLVQAQMGDNSTMTALCGGGGKAVAKRDIIEHRGGAWVLLSKKTGEVLGKHKTKGEAEAQERAVQANKHTDGARVRVRRYDTYSVDALAPPQRLPNGWLRVEGRISRVGIQEYQDADGRTHFEFRPPEEVFDPESMRSFEMVPMTNTHPTQLLDAQSARMHSVGSVGQDLRRDGDWLAAPLMITDAMAIAAAERGRAELSCGYECELDPTPGVYQGQRYDSIQRRIRGNHVALVDEARAGHDARLRLDGSDAAMVAFPQSSTSSNTRSVKMPQTIVIDGKRIELSDANVTLIQSALDAQQSRIDSLIKGKRAAELLALKFKHRLDDDEPDGDDDDEEMDDDVDCPQCGGTGKLVKAGDDDAMIGCDMCDGSGQIKASSLGEFGGEIEDDDDDYDDLKKDVDELEVEQETEKEAAGAHKDWKGRRDARAAKRRKDAAKRRKDAAQKFSAAVKRRVDAAVRARAKLEVKAREALGPEVELSKLDDAGVKKAVIAKAFPEFKADGKSAEVIDDRYSLALEQLSGGGGGGGGGTGVVVTNVDGARGALRMPRQLATPGGAGGPPSRARIDHARAEREKKMQAIPFDRNKAREIANKQAK
jgi:hypothetical protein